MAQAGKVAEIFTTAGESFTKLGNLAMSLQPGAEKGSTDSKWGDEEIDMLHSAVKQFGSEVEKISTKVRSKASAQQKLVLRQKALLQGSNAGASSVKINSTLGTNFQTIQTLNSSNVTNATIVGLRPQIKVATTPRQIGQKGPYQTMTIRGATPMNTTQMTKKIRLDASSLSALTSNSPMNTIIRQSNPVAIAPAGNTGAIGVPIMASSQGFQVIVPPQKTAVSGATMLPVSLLQSGIVQKVSNVASAANVDIES
ncbi:uncharacterized protein [Clytia hemisphaerica]|uniref:Uncharacterized protein n=1 Tax=Clytia hemisphaerica TaxID=252671 RepID=A0A7M5TQQ3_9CNID